MAVTKPGLIALFDVDGTLTAPRKVLISLKKHCQRKIRINIKLVHPLKLTFLQFKFQAATPSMLEFIKELRKVLIIFTFSTKKTGYSYFMESLPLVQGWRVKEYW